MQPRTPIQDLEQILNDEEETPIHILPNGEIRREGQTGGVDLGARKPLTLKENLGGEY